MVGRGQRGVCVWLTGLPASGKTTLAELLATELRSQGRPVAVLDGDAVRRQFAAQLGFSPQDRNENVRRIAARRGIARFVEVHVDCPLSVCEARDPKGLYARARSGEVCSFTGVDDVYETPVEPELRVQTHLQTPLQAIAHIGATLAALGYLQEG